MQNKKLAALLLAVVVASPAILFAEEAKKDTPVNVGARVYARWTATEGKTNGEEDQKQQSFVVDRVYLDVRKPLDEYLSARVTFDVMPVDYDGDGKEEYEAYLKYAYLEGAYDFSGIKTSIRFGQIETPVVGYVDSVSDVRWLYNNYIDKSKDLVGTSIDHSADQGVGFKVNVLGFAEFDGSYTNGEGYKDVQEGIDDGKAMTGRLSLMPIPGMSWISLNGFYRTQDKDTTAKDSSLENSLTYMGGGFSIKHNIIKCGANYVTIAQKVDDEDKKNAEDKTEELYLVDAWVSLNGQDVIGLPVLAYGRYSFGEDKALSADSKKTVISGGLGYQYSSNFRIMGYYSQATAPDGTEGKIYDRSYSVKTEFKF